MYCVYRNQIEEYVPGRGWADDGFIYSTDCVKLQEEVQRRVTTCYHDQVRVRAGKQEIVVVKETFLADLKKIPVLSTVNGIHEADLGGIREYSEKVKKERSMLGVADYQHLRNQQSSRAW